MLVGFGAGLRLWGLMAWFRFVRRRGVDIVGRDWGNGEGAGCFVVSLDWE